MSPSLVLRAALRARPSAIVRVARSPVTIRPATAAFSNSALRREAAKDPHDPHGEETFEEFTARYVGLGYVVLGGAGDVVCAAMGETGQLWW